MTSFICRESREEREIIEGSRTKPLLLTTYQEATAFLPHGVTAGRVIRFRQYSLRCAANGIAGDCISSEMKGVFAVFNVLLLVLYEERRGFRRRPPPAAHGLGAAQCVTCDP